MMTTNQTQYLIQNSPWPVMISVASFNLLTSIYVSTKTNLISLSMMSGVTIAVMSLMWWMNYSDECNKKGEFTNNLDKMIKTSMILFISSEIMFFFTFFWCFFDFNLTYTMESGMNWPPKDTGTFDCTKAPLTNTVILLSSGVTITMAHMYLNEGKMNKMTKMMKATMILGGMFTMIQGMEYMESKFSLYSNTYANTFFLLTGFHGLHVIIGNMFLMFSNKMISSMKSAKSNQISFELSAWYWHFVDVIWIVVYTLLYYMCEL